MGIISQMDGPFNNSVVSAGFKDFAELSALRANAGRRKRLGYSGSFTAVCIDISFGVTPVLYVATSGG